MTTLSGEQISARAVVSATHVLTTLDLLGRNDEAQRARLRTGTGLGMVLRVLTDRLPSYAVSHVDGDTHRHADAGRLARADPPGTR